MIKKLLNFFKQAPRTARELGFRDLTEFDDVRLVRLTHPEHLLEPDVYDLARAALSSNPLCDLKKGLLQLAQLTTSLKTGIYCVKKADQWCGMAIVTVQEGLVDGASVLHFYHTGPRATREVLLSAIVQHARAFGARRVFGTDVNDRYGGASRLYAGLGKPTPYGQVIGFEIDG